MSDDDTFAINPPPAKAAAQVLGTTRARMNNMKKRFDQYDSAIGSSKISNALDKFFEDSSDHRKKTNASLGTTEGKLKGAAHGAEKYDAGWKKGLEGKKKGGGN